MFTPSSQRAFSLVELSIVLVILGLLTGGILAGQSLIRGAELRAVATESNRYISATQSFKDKYFSIPGDMTNATTYWGAADGSTGNTAACATAVGTGTQTCNGDGNGIPDTSTASKEYIRFWQHLANAGLIEGTYTGISYTPAYLRGTNVPASRVTNGIWLVIYVGNTPGNTLVFTGDYGSGFGFFAQGFSFSTAGSLPLTPEEAWSLDTKLDDGMPSTGTVRPYKGNGTNTNCTTFAGVAPPGDAGATYLLTNRSKDCALVFLKAY